MPGNFFKLASILEEALIMESRIEFAADVLESNRAEELHTQLMNLLNSEPVTVNIEQLAEFVEDRREEIHNFDVTALDMVSAIQELEEERKEEEKYTKDWEVKDDNDR